jgi:hypothetical protein
VYRERRRAALREKNASCFSEKQTRGRGASYVTYTETYTETYPERARVTARSCFVISVSRFSRRVSSR